MVPANIEWINSCKVLKSYRHAVDWRGRLADLKVGSSLSFGLQWPHQSLKVRTYLGCGPRLHLSRLVYVLKVINTNVCTVAERCQAH